MTIIGVKCPVCSDIVFSRAVNDIRWCWCGSIEAHGGFIEPDIMISSNECPTFTTFELPVTPDELYDDWNLSIDKLGVITERNENYSGNKESKPYRDFAREY
jgi:hypothetical protein